MAAAPLLPQTLDAPCVENQSRRFYQTQCGGRM